MKACLHGLRDSLSLLKVCQAMCNLNRLARGSEDKETIYRYKARLIYWLHEHRYCSVSIRRQDQVLECWHTPDYNTGWTDHCSKCGGSGIYKRIPMFRFRFYIESETFTWHQPANLINWEVQETGEPLPDWPGVSRHDGKTSPADLWTVRWFLILRRLLPIGFPR